MEKHFVTFFSPGTFVHETTEQPIDAWDIEKAKDLAHGIVERYGATPFAFQFSTRTRGPDDLDSKVTAKSPNYYLGGKIETLAEVEARNDPKEEILRSNMRGNGYGEILVNTNSWKVVVPFRDGDVLLDWKPKKKRKVA